MFITRVKMKNYRQHRDRDVTFEGNLILIIGRNGNGKSNFTGALQFALTGEQTGFNKDQLVSWGEADGTVELWFTHDGQQGHIERAIISNKAKFEFGTDSYTGIKNVNEALRVRIGIDKDMAKQSVFVRQGELDEVLFSEPRARELSFQRLMGTGDAAKIHKAMGDLISELSVPPNYDEQIAQGVLRRHTDNERLAGLKAQLTVLQQQGTVDLTSIRQQADGVSTMASQLKRGTDLLSDVQHKADESAATERELAAIPQVAGDINQIDATIKELEVLDREASAWAVLANEFNTAGTALAALGEAPTSEAHLIVLRDRWAAARAEVDRFAGQSSLYESLQSSLSRLNTATECPVCGSPITDVNQLKTRLATSIAQLKVQAETPKREADAVHLEGTRLRTAFEAYQRESTTRQARLADLKRRMAVTREVTADLQKTRSTIQELQTTRRAVLHTLNQRSALTERLSGLKRESERITSQLQDVQATLTGLTCSREGYTAGITLCQSELARLRSVEAVEQTRQLEAAKLDGTVRELEKALNVLDDTIAKLEHSKSQQSTYKTTLEALTRTRDWFHYANGPRTLANSVLGEMNQDVNRFLSQFTAPFTVIPSQEMFGFKVVFTDGRTTPKEGPPDATILSGGEKVQLAVAFRFASYYMFANKLGLLLLDEPTAYLDSVNIGRFCDLMTQVKQIAKGMNLQVFMCTHEEALMPFADTIVDLTKKD